MTPDEPFSPNLGEFLAPIPGDENPAGPSMRYDPVWAQIQQARENEDPDLPRGDWTRKLKQSDWPLVERLCTQVLQKRSKDLQVAFWLTEAWIHLHGMPGLQAGVDLVMVLVRQFWDGVHPLIDDGDTDARVSPFIWANTTLPTVLRLHLPLVHMVDHRPSVGTLELWDRTLNAPGSDTGRLVPDEDGHLPGNRISMANAAQGEALFALADMGDDLRETARAWSLLNAMLDEKLGPDAPGLGKVADTLEQLQRVVASLLDGRDPRLARAEPDSLAIHHEPEPLPEDAPAMTDTPTPPPPPASSTAMAVPNGGLIANRDDAYRLLELAAAYLERNEPHSPTPYLVKRAVTWGRMSLADLMQEILREEGDLTRYFSLLGINTDRG